MSATSHYFRGVAIVATLFVSTPFALAQDEASAWQGPLPMQNQRPFQAAFLHFPAKNPDVLPAGQGHLGLQLDLANNLLIPNASNGATVDEDFETQRLQLSYSRGLGHRLEGGISSSIIGRNGGFLDAPIEAYHHLLGLGGDGEDNPQGRDDTPRGRSRLFFDDGNGHTINEGSAFGLGDTTLTLQKQIAGGKLAAAGRVGLKIPTGSGSKVLGSGGLDLGVAFDARYQLAHKVALFGNAGAMHYGSSDIPNAKKSGLQGGLGIEWRKSGSESYIAQIDASTRVVKTGNSFADGTPSLASVGYKRRISENRSFWASFSENGDYTNFHAPFFGNIGPDFTISLGFDVRR